MKIQVYMTQDCPKCATFGKNLEESINELDLDEEIEQLDLEQAIEIGVTSCPAIIINGEIKSRGILLSVEELKKLLKENM